MMQCIVLASLCLLFIDLNPGKAVDLDSSNNKPVSLISRYQGCQRYGKKILICATLQAAISRRNEWTNIKQM